MRHGSRNKKQAKAIRATYRPSSVEAGSGNVFADLGLGQAEIVLAKAVLVQKIRDLIAARKLSQTQAAETLGLDQPKVSALVRGRVAGYTIDRLLRSLLALGQRVEITVRPVDTAKPHAKKQLVVA